MTGTEWRYTKESEPVLLSRISRSQAQAIVNDLMVARRITDAQWSALTDQLGDPRTKDYAAVLPLFAR